MRLTRNILTLSYRFINRKGNHRIILRKWRQYGIIIESDPSYVNPVGRKGYYSIDYRKLNKQTRPMSDVNDQLRSL